MAPRRDCLTEATTTFPELLPIDVPLAPLPVRPSAVDLLARDLPPMDASSQAANEDELRALLQDIAELDLKDFAETAPTWTPPRTRLAERAREIKEKSGQTPGGFPAYLMATRADLAGLPFRKIPDRSLAEEQAQTLWGMGVAVECASAVTAAAERTPVSSYSFASYGSSGPPAERPGFWETLEQLHRNRQSVLKNIKIPDPESEEALPGLRQLFPIQKKQVRLLVIEHLQRVTGKQVGAALAQWAVFDLDQEVRAAALSALKGRSGDEYREVFVDALRYPWRPASERAAEALAVLRPKGVVSGLVQMLDEPDPTAPFLQEVEGREMPVVRELVRINHHRNCLLCHAPSFDAKDLVRGVVPVPGEPLPPLYDFHSKDRTFVRADITYLRQDFSVMQQVKAADPWPKLQRYDYVVRTRPLTQDEQKRWQPRREQTDLWPYSPYRRAVLYALCGVTGEYAGTTTEAWQRWLREHGDGPTVQGQQRTGSGE